MKDLLTEKQAIEEIIAELDENNPAHVIKILRLKNKLDEVEYQIERALDKKDYENKLKEAKKKVAQLLAEEESTNLHNDFMNEPEELKVTLVPYYAEKLDRKNSIYHRLESCGYFASARGQVFDIILRHPEQLCTEEIAAKLKKRYGNVAPRISELKTSGLLKLGAPKVYMLTDEDGNVTYKDVDTYIALVPQQDSELELIYRRPKTEKKEK